MTKRPLTRVTTDIYSSIKKPATKPSQLTGSQLLYWAITLSLSRYYCATLLPLCKREYVATFIFLLPSTTIFKTELKKKKREDNLMQLTNHNILLDCALSINLITESNLMSKYRHTQKNPASPTLIICMSWVKKNHPGLYTFKCR